MHVIKSSQYSFEVIFTPAELEVLQDIDNIKEPLRTLKFEYIQILLMLNILDVVGAPTGGD